ncbi:MAG: transporter substrate-binding domain-containing protein [Acidimicrobiales bacterium]
MVALGCHAGRQAGGAPPRSAAAAGLVPAALRGRGVLMVGLDAVDLPDEFLAPDGHSVVGLDADLVNAIGGVLGLKVRLVDGPLPSILPEVASGQLDLGMSSIADRATNRAQDDLVTYFTSGEALFEAQKRPVAVSDPSLLCGYSVAVASGTAEEVAAKAQVQLCESKQKPASNVLIFQNLQAAEIAVESGRVQLGFFLAEAAEYAVGQSKGQLMLAGAPIDPMLYGIATAPGPLAAAVQAAMKTLIDDGRYANILHTWHLQAGAISDPGILPALAPPRAPTTTATTTTVRP